jgi:hypothetical protein
MKQLNENWFSITLIAVIFGLLGFLIGENHNKTPLMPHKMHKKKIDGKQKMMWIKENGNVQIKIDTLDKNGKKNIEVIVIKKD